MTSDQLELRLDWRSVGEPWNGTPPRMLTSAFKEFRFAPEGMAPLYPAISDEHLRDQQSWSDPDQLLLFIGGGS